MHTLRNMVSDRRFFLARLHAGEGNKCADMMAKHRCDGQCAVNFFFRREKNFINPVKIAKIKRRLEVSTVIFNSIPSFIFNLLHDDSHNALSFHQKAINSIRT